MTKPRRRVVFPVWSRPLLAIPIVVAVGWWTHDSIEQHIRGRMKETLETTLNADRGALELWMADQGKLATLAASDPRVVDLVTGLLDVSRRTSGDPKSRARRRSRRACARSWGRW